MTTKKKLIEVALPLEAINKASAYKKTPGIGLQTGDLHLCWPHRGRGCCDATLGASPFWRTQ